MTAPGGAGEPIRPRARWVLRALAAVGIVTLLWLARGPLLEALPGWLAAVRGAGGLGVVGFVGLYVAWTVLLLPGSALTAAAGAVWGVGPGLCVASPASVLGATVAFLLSRGALRARVERRVRGDPRLQAVDREVGRGGLRAVLLLRLSPLVPFNVLNYALGLTGVRLRDYVVGSFFGMLPGTLLYVWLGSLAEEAGQVAAGRGGPERLAVLVLGLVATAILAFWGARIARGALEEPHGG